MGDSAINHERRRNIEVAAGIAADETYLLGLIADLLRHIAFRKKIAQMILFDSHTPDKDTYLHATFDESQKHLRMLLGLEDERREG